MTEVLLDTNIFIRFLMHDLEDQYQQVKKIFVRIEQSKLTGLVSILVINELIWILNNYYHIERSVYIPQIIALLAFSQLKVVEVDKLLLIEILEKLATSKIDFTDLYLFSISNSDQKVLSFDKDFLKLNK